MRVYLGNQLHENGDTKDCHRCASTVRRLKRQNPAVWRRIQYCRACGPQARKKTLTVGLLRDLCSINEASGCWEWGGRATKKTENYSTPIIWVNGKNRIASRVMWEISFGDIPKGMFVCHRCDLPLCLNPEHLFLGTHRDNMDDMVQKGRNARPRGDMSATSILREEQVRKIMIDDRPGVVIAKEYGVARTTIYAIKGGQNWGWLK